MNILYLHRIWPYYGGGETVTRCLSKELTISGHNVFVAYFHDSNSSNSSFEDLNDIVSIKIHNIKFNEFSSEFFVSKRKSRNVRSELNKIINKYNIDIVINQWWPVEFHSEVVESVVIIKCLHMDVDIKRQFGKLNESKIFNVIYPLYRIIETKKNYYKLNKYYNNSDLFVFLCKSSLNKYLYSSKNICAEKLDFVYNPSPYILYTTKEQICSKKKQVLFVGRVLEKHKQLCKLFDIWKQFCFTNPDWSLIIVGEGQDKAMCEKYVVDNKVYNVIFEGFKNPLDYYKEASIFVMTSAYEGFPMTLIESMQNGVVPIVYNTFSAVEEIIINEYNGFVISNNDSNSFLNALQTLANNHEIRLKYAINGLSHCKQFDISSIISKWIDIFEKINKLK